MAVTFNNLGNYYKAIGDLTNASEYYCKALKYKLFLLSPSAWIPAVCVNTLSPTIGLLAGIL